jgi:membrane-associated phospholipid phosphatase
MTSRPGPRPPITLPIAAACAFLLLAALAIGGWPPVDAADRSISEGFRELGNANPGLISWVRIATDVATTIPFLAAGVLLTLFLAVRRERRNATLTALITAAVPALWALMHLWLSHPRPENGFVTVDSNGFPSGHTSNATAAALLAFYLLRPRLSRRATTLLIAGATLFALLVGLSRLTLLAHWPTEVLGGWLLGLAVVPTAAHFLAPTHPALRSPTPTEDPAPHP